MRTTLLCSAIALAGFLGLPADASAQATELERLTCESSNNRHQECRYNSSGDVIVKLVRQISSKRCVFDRNWGTFDGGVWVDYGCRAEFSVQRPPNAGRPVGGTLQTTTCESRDNANFTCRIPGIDSRSVHLERKLSGAACIQGYSWGVSDGENSPPGIWVAHGCRGVFSYRTGGGEYAPYSGTPHDFELPCESLRGEWTHCDVPQVRSARVERIAGNNACNAYKAWGVDDTGVWVRSNCQGVFRVRYRH